MKSFISIDWDYFMNYIKDYQDSEIENKNNIIMHWYKIYLENKSKGIDLSKKMSTSGQENIFWKVLKQKFKLTKNTKLIVTESHANAYEIIKNSGCEKVYSFDAHSDLGYGGLRSLYFEVNCANWLGKLLDDNIIKEANIVYSKYTGERPEYFKEINDKFNVNYLRLEDIKESDVFDIIHICRSGAWSAPWLDKKFYEFLNKSKLNYEIKGLQDRTWNPNSINLAMEIDCLIYG
ncbi:arginase [Romboutsia lituseburensis]|nr:arginase [Romboutsia lituseburensis]